MNIDISSRKSDHNDKDEYDKIKLSGDFEKLNLSSEEELIIKRYLYYSEKILGTTEITINSETRSVSKCVDILTITFMIFDREVAIKILNCLGNDMSIPERISCATLCISHLREIAQSMTIIFDYIKE